jgi:hypothetical protein
MNNDMTCDNAHHPFEAINEPAVDLTIILDTTWPFDIIQQIIRYLFHCVFYMSNRMLIRIY